ncbi:MAG: HD domain-containing protein [Gammaproteobacteria bacterium]|nr:HD domain-containing protein [Gammaproteobacteria bacterium]
MPLTTSLPRTPVFPLVLRFARIEAGGLARRIARAFGLHRPVPLPLDELRIPDTKMAGEALALVEQCSPPLLVNHSLRTWCFGVAVARQLRLKPDLEVFFLAAIMHDLGLVDAYDGEDSFELEGARAAHAFLCGRDYPRERADLVHEAIALHAAVGVADALAPEIALVHFGAGVDVIGYRAEDVARETCDAVVARYPRLDFKREFSRMIEAQATRKPRCHIAGHVGLGFSRKIAAAPFAE